MKKIVKSCFMLVLITALGLNVISANALSNDKVGDTNEEIFEMSGDCGDIYTHEPITLDQQLENVINSEEINEGQKLKVISKINSAKEINEGQENSIVTRASNTYNCTRSIPYYKQQNSYYCGPATTKQSLQYLKGTSPSQSTIASSLGTTTSGTDGTKIVEYLNNNQSSNYYVIVEPTSQSAMESTIYSGLTNFNAPPILRVKITSGQVSTQHPQSWYYTTNGHFMNISGQYTVNGSTIYQVTDPYIEYKASSITSGKYRINSSAVYTSTMNHFAHHFYY